MDDPTHQRRSAVSTSLRPVPRPSGSPPADPTARERRVVLHIIYRYFHMNFFLSCLQVIVGGGLVFAAGVIIGSS